MLLGKIFGKVTTNEFKFLATAEVKKFEYIQVYHEVYDYVLAQIIELEKTQESTIASCQIIGYIDKKDKKVKSLRIPLEPNTEVFLAEISLIEETIQLTHPENGAYIGKLDGKDININLDLKKLLTKHLAVLAKSGSGKSYAVGVLLEEIIDKKVPLLIIDPHGEYSTLKSPNTTADEIERMAQFNISPKGFPTQEYSDTKINIYAKPLKLPNDFTPSELIEILPQKLSSNQIGLLHNAIKTAESTDISEIILALHAEDSNIKWGLIGLLEQIKNLEIFSSAPTPYHEMIKSGTASIINLRGLDPDIQDIIVYKLTKDLFELRKQTKIPPFFLVIEESHNFCPERSFGEKKSSKMLRTIASEGRKFGLGLCVISQRPARIDKSVISQCTTQIIMKLTNPNDLKAITSSVEGITSTTESEIQNLTIGTALITGITDVPLFVNIRPRQSQHGGHSINILEGVEPNETNLPEEQDLLKELETFKEKNLLPIIKPTITKQDIQIMSEKQIKKISTILIPAYQIVCKEKDAQFNLIVEQIEGKIVTNIDEFQTKILPELHKLTKKELALLQTAFTKKSFKALDLIKTLGTNIDVNKDLEALHQKNYLLKLNQETYKLNPDYIFTSLTNFKNHSRIEFVNVEFDLKKEPLIGLDKIIELIQKFTTVIDNNQVYILNYQIEHYND